MYPQGIMISLDTTDVLDVQDDLYDKNLFAYCDNNPVTRTDSDGELWELALAGGGAISAGSGVSIMAGIGTIIPVGLARVGSVAIASGVAITVKYAKSKSKTKSKKKGKTKTETKERVKKPIAKRYRFNSRKKQNRQHYVQVEGKCEMIIVKKVHIIIQK